MKNAIKIVLGSFCVYAIVAACSASDGSRRPGAQASGGNGGNGGGIMDALTDPVKDAHAGQTEYTANCTKTFTYAGSTYYYAEVAVPGRTAHSLAGTMTYITPPAGSSALPAGYSWVSMAAVKDGAVEATCTGPNAQQYSVTFIVPN